MIISLTFVMRAVDYKCMITSDCEDSSGDESCNDCVEGVVLLPVVDQQAVHRREHAAPHRKTTYTH